MSKMFRAAVDGFAAILARAQAAFIGPANYLEEEKDIDMNPLIEVRRSAAGVVHQIVLSNFHQMGLNGLDHLNAA